MYLIPKVAEIRERRLAANLSQHGLSLKAGLLEKWKTSTQPIRVIISDCDFNLAMSIDKLTKKHREGDKDVYYTLELSEYRFLNVPAVQVETQQQSDTNGLNNRPNTQTTPKSYTVVSGDCLWNIAKKYYGDGSQ